MTDVELEIDELILDGFLPADSARIEAALRRELTRLFAERGLPASLTRSSQLPRLDGGRAEVTPSAAAEMIGTCVAQTLYGSLDR
jgi:hypothetical protein